MTTWFPTSLENTSRFWNHTRLLRLWLTEVDLYEFVGLKGFGLGSIFLFLQIPILESTHETVGSHLHWKHAMFLKIICVCLFFGLPSWISMSFWNRRDFFVEEASRVWNHMRVLILWLTELDFYVFLKLKGFGSEAFVLLLWLSELDLYVFVRLRGFGLGSFFSF